MTSPIDRTAEPITLLDKALLVQIYVSPVSKQFGYDSAKQMAVERLQNAGLIMVLAHEDALQATQRGKVLAEAIRNLPLPIEQWVMPA